MKKILFLLLSVALLVGCTTGKTQKPSFTGTWYASQYGCRSVVHFNEDSTITISSEANSAANMTVGYVVSPRPMAIISTLRWVWRIAVSPSSMAQTICRLVSCSVRNSMLPVRRSMKMPIRHMEI